MKVFYCKYLLIFFVIAARKHSFIFYLCLEVIQESQLFYWSLISGDCDGLRRGIFRFWILSLDSVTIRICYWLILTMRKYKSSYAVNPLWMYNRNQGSINGFIIVKRINFLTYLLYFIKDLCSLRTIDLWRLTDCLLFL